MDINIARTFLEVCRTRHFGEAAQSLHVTTSAVSARIRSLEDELGTPLFVRLHNDIALTDAARRLIPQFRELLQTWEQIRYAASVASAPAPNLNAGFTPGLWACIHPNWVKVMLHRHETLKIKIESASSSTLFDRLHRTQLDVVFTVEPHTGDDVRSAPVGEMLLSLYADRPGLCAQDMNPRDYIHVDWGTSFLGQLARVQADYLQAQIAVSNVRLAADLLMDMPGMTYMPQALSESLSPLLRTHLVSGAPTFHVPIYGTCLISNAKATWVHTLQEVLRDSLAQTSQTTALRNGPSP